MGHAAGGEGGQAALWRSGGKRQRSQLLSSGASYFCSTGCKDLCCICEPPSSRTVLMGPQAREALRWHHEPICALWDTTELLQEQVTICKLSALNSQPVLEDTHNQPAGSSKAGGKVTYNPVTSISHLEEQHPGGSLSFSTGSSILCLHPWSKVPPTHGVHAYPGPKCRGWISSPSNTQYINLAPLQ